MPVSSSLNLAEAMSQSMVKIWDDGYSSDSLRRYFYECVDDPMDDCYYEYSQELAVNFALLMSVVGGLLVVQGPIDFLAEIYNVWKVTHSAPVGVERGASTQKYAVKASTPAKKATEKVTKIVPTSTNVSQNVT